MAFSANRAGQVGPQGPPGPPGPPGTGAEATTVQRIAGETISALKLVRSNGPEVVLAEPDTYLNAQVFGIALTAGNPGDTINVLLIGLAADSGWSWLINEPLFLGANGSITQTPPTSGILARVGKATKATEISFEVDEPIILEA